MSNIREDQTVLIKDAIKNSRNAKCMTQEELSEAAGIPLSTLKKYEQGIRIPNFNSLVRLNKVLGLNLVSLISCDPADESEKDGKKYRAMYLRDEGFTTRNWTFIYDFSGSPVSEKDKIMLALSRAYDSCKSGESLIGFTVVLK